MSDNYLRWLLRLLGSGFMLLGLLGAYYGPLEFYPFYLFSEGGRFHYPGFGFGAFMFANIAAQVMGYYLVALVFIPLGYGHLRLRDWARPLALTYVTVWLVLGLPLSLTVLFMLFSVKDLSVAAGVFFLVLAVFGYPVAPLLLVRFYRWRRVVGVFTYQPDQDGGWSTAPILSRALVVLSLFFALALHTAIFLNGSFPLFGGWLHGLQGIMLLDVSIWLLAFLAWTALKRYRWSWWIGAAVYAALLATVASTLVVTDFQNLLIGLNLPERELVLLGGMPLEGWHLALFAGIPLAATLGLWVSARRYFNR